MQYRLEWIRTLKLIAPTRVDKSSGFHSPQTPKRRRFNLAFEPSPRLKPKVRRTVLCYEPNDRSNS